MSLGKLYNRAMKPLTGDAPVFSDHIEEHAEQTVPYVEDAINATYSEPYKDGLAAIGDLFNVTGEGIMPEESVAEGTYREFYNISDETIDFFAKGDYGFFFDDSADYQNQY